MARVNHRMKEISGQSQRGVTHCVERLEHVDPIRGDARFVGPRSIEVDGARLEANRIFINVGARPRVPAIPGLDEVEHLTSSDMLELDELPEHLIVIGGSETQGFIKILVDAHSEEILGAAVLGIGADEVVHGLLDLMYAKQPYTVISRAVHIHPTVSELIPTTLQYLEPLEP